MTDRRPKLLAKLEQNPKAVTPDFLETVLGQFGYWKDRQSGSHMTYRNADGDKMTVPYRRPHLKQHYVERVIAKLSAQLDDTGRSPTQEDVDD